MGMFKTTLFEALQCADSWDVNGHCVYVMNIDGGLQVRTLHRKERILDDDLPEIAKAYAEFRAKHPEPNK